MSAAHRIRSLGSKSLRWLLAVLCLRAMVPIGFMVAPLADGVAVVLCPGHGPSGPQAHHHPGGHRGAAGFDAGGLCPFALSAAPAPLPALSLPTLSPAGILPSVIDAACGRLHPCFGPRRELPARAPPAHA